MKKTYIAPAARIIQLQMEQPILSASISVDNDTEIDASESYSDAKEYPWESKDSEW